MGLKRAAVAALAGFVLMAGQPATAQPADPNLSADARAVLLVGFGGPHLDPTVRRHLEEGGRGVILFSSNVASRSQITALTTATACAADKPVLIAIDQEPGPVQRLRGMVAPLPSPWTMATNPAGEVFDLAARLGKEMGSMGINVDLAPVLDVVGGPNPVLAGRTFPGDPEAVGALGTAFVAGLQSTRVVAVTKHFPGHGRSRTDPHSVVTTITASREELAGDLVPFRMAVDGGVKAVLVGHPVYASLDPDHPASLSPAVLDLLRDDLGFGGVAVTDGLAMRAVRADRTLPEAAVQALRAGQDLLIVEDVRTVDSVVHAIVRAVEQGELDRSRLAEAAARVRSLAAWAVQPRCSGVPARVHRN